MITTGLRASSEAIFTKEEPEEDPSSIAMMPGGMLDELSSDSTLCGSSSESSPLQSGKCCEEGPSDRSPGDLQQKNILIQTVASNSFSSNDPHGLRRTKIHKKCVRILVTKIVREKLDYCEIYNNPGNPYFLIIYLVELKNKRK